MNLSGSPTDYIFAFIGGLLVSFTSCIYPLLPITIGLISNKSDNSKIKSFLLSFTYVTGIAITYSILGLIVSFTGMFFGKISAHPVTLIFVGAVIILCSVFMWMDLLNISWPGIRVDRNKRDYFSTLLLGASSGLIASPCLTPVLGAILSYLVTKKNIIYGMSLLVVFSYGMGLTLILAGTFGSILLNLPKSGKWMVYVKRAGSLMLLFMGSYFIYKGIRNF